MMPDPFGIPFEELPRDIPIFPLPGAMLLPKGRLPLNLFEPRYLNMAIDAMAEKRMIGMVQPLELLRDPVPETAGLFKIGCAGRIISFSETDDRRIMITLRGICRFHIDQEIEGRNGYRRVRADYDPFKHDLEETAVLTLDRERLLDLLKVYFTARGARIDWKALQEADDDAVVTSMAMMCPFDVTEKQALLEAATLQEMSDVLMTLLSMAENESSAAKH